jgi:histidine phosphotransferase ChpT
MTSMPPYDDLSLSALMSSKICHDLVGPVGAINNGLELLEEEDDGETRAYALQLIQNSARSAAAKLEFARLAFGASTGMGGSVDLAYAEKITRRFVEDGKHALSWSPSTGTIGKLELKLVLITLCVAQHAIPGGGRIAVEIESDAKRPSFLISCSGRTARIPEIASDIFAGKPAQNLETRTVMPYLAHRLAQDLRYSIAMAKEGDLVTFTGSPLT